MYVVMNKSKDRISTENKHMMKYIMRKIDQRPNGFMFRVGVSRRSTLATSTDSTRLLSSRT